MPDPIYPVLSPVYGTWQEAMRQIAEAFRFHGEGKLDCQGDVTLGASTTTTVVTDVRVGPQSNILLGAMSATAKAVDPYVKVADIGEETFTITHGSAADTDMAVRYSVLG